MRKWIFAGLWLTLALVWAQPASKILNQPLPLDGATVMRTPEERVLRALAVTEGKRCVTFEGWVFAKATTASEYSKLIEVFNDGLVKAGWKLEPKGNLAQGGSNVEVFKLIGAKKEQILGYWLLSNNQSQLIWCRLG